MKHTQIIFLFLINHMCNAKKYVKDEKILLKRNLFLNDNFTLCMNLQTNSLFQKRSIKKNAYFSDTQKCLRYSDVHTAHHLSKMRIVLNKDLDNMEVIKEILQQYKVKNIETVEIIVPNNFKATPSKITAFNQILRKYNIQKIHTNMSIYKSYFKDIKQEELNYTWLNSLSSSTSSDDNRNSSSQSIHPLYIGIQQNQYSHNEFIVNTNFPKEHNNTIKIEFCAIFNVNMLHHVCEKLKKEFRQTSNTDQCSIIVDNFECCDNNAFFLKWLLGLDNKEITFYNPTGISTCIKYVQQHKKDYQNIYFEITSNMKSALSEACEKYNFSPTLVSSSAYHKKYLIEQRD